MVHGRSPAVSLLGENTPTAGRGSRPGWRPMSSIDLNVDAKITEQDLERVRARLGEVNPITGAYNTEAAKDAIRHFAEGIGDDNPLWTDPAYAERTRWGTLLAPPSFLM